MLQASLLPRSLPTIPGVELAAQYLAGGEGMEVGGDFYDVFDLAPDAWALTIGDVAARARRPRPSRRWPATRCARWPTPRSCPPRRCAG